MKSVMSKDFSRIAWTDGVRSTFDRGHGLKTAFNSGYLVPIELQEVVPSDTVDFDVRFLARLSPVVTPVMDNVYLDLHAFFVPSRLIWNNFTKLMGERKNPNDSIDYLVPKIYFSEYDADAGVGSLADYLGLPVNQFHSSNFGGNVSVSALPFRAYQKIWDDWYRDENLQESVIQSTDELGDAIFDKSKWCTLRKRGKRHDYFTSCLPWPQKGAGVNMPLGQYANVIGDGKALGLTDGTNRATLFTGTSNATINRGIYNGKIGNKVGSAIESSETFGFDKSVGVVTDPNTSGLIADLSTATAATVESLRMAFQIQVQLERDARSGTRYNEIIRENFKCICPDARLQRSEYLGGHSQQITFSPIAQTSETSTTPQGNLTATAHAYCDGWRFTRSFSEHGYILILASVRADLNYQQGIDRLWTRSSRWDFYWPAFAHLGEQAVLNKEVYAQGDQISDSDGNILDDQVFGYQERYAEMRYNPSRVTGRLRSGVDGSLDVWHLAQYFDSLPQLSPVFIEEDPPLRRVMAITDENEPEVIFDSFIGQKWTRPCPTYSIPGLIDHL